MPQQRGAEYSQPREGGEEKEGKLLDFLSFRKRTETRASGDGSDAKKEETGEGKAKAKKEKKKTIKKGGGTGGEGGGDDGETEKKKKIAAKEKSLREQLRKYENAGTEAEEGVLEDKINKLADELLALGVDVLALEKWQKLFEKAGLGAAEDEPENEEEVPEAEILDDAAEEQSETAANPGKGQENVGFQLDPNDPLLASLKAAAGEMGGEAHGTQIEGYSAETTAEQAGEQETEFQPFTINAQEKVESVEKKLGIDPEDLVGEGERQLRELLEKNTGKFNLKPVLDRFVLVLHDVNKIKTYLSDRKGATRMAGEIADADESEKAVRYIRAAQEMLEKIFGPAIDEFKELLLEERAPDATSTTGFTYNPEAVRSPADIPHALRPRLLCALAVLEMNIEAVCNPILRLLAQDTGYVGEQPKFLGKDTAEKNEFIARGVGTESNPGDEHINLEDAIGQIMRPENALLVGDAFDAGTLYIAERMPNGAEFPASGIVRQLLKQLQELINVELPEALALTKQGDKVRRVKEIRKEIMMIITGSTPELRGVSDEQKVMLPGLFFEIRTPEQQATIEALAAYRDAIDERLELLTVAATAGYEDPTAAGFVRDLEARGWRSLATDEKIRVCARMLPAEVLRDMEHVVERINEATAEMLEVAKRPGEFVNTLQGVERSRGIVVVEHPDSLAFFDNDIVRGTAQREAFMRGLYARYNGKQWTEREQERSVDDFLTARHRVNDALTEAWLYEMGGEEKLQQNKQELQRARGKTVSDAQVLTEWRTRMILGYGDVGLRDELFKRFDQLIDAEVTAHGAFDTALMYNPQNLEEVDFNEYEGRLPAGAQVDREALKNPVRARILAEMLIWDAAMMWDHAAHRIENPHITQEERAELLVRMAAAHRTLARFEARIAGFVNEGVRGAAEKSRTRYEGVVTRLRNEGAVFEGAIKGGEVMARHDGHPHEKMKNWVEAQVDYYEGVHTRNYIQKQAENEFLGRSKDYWKAWAQRHWRKFIPGSMAVGGSVLTPVLFVTGLTNPFALGAVVAAEVTAVVGTILYQKSQKAHRVAHEIEHDGMHRALEPQRILSKNPLELRDFLGKFLRTKKTQGSNDNLTYERFPDEIARRFHGRKDVEPAQKDREYKGILGRGLAALRESRKSLSEKIQKNLKEHLKHHAHAAHGGGHGDHDKKETKIEFKDPDPFITDRLVALTEYQAELLGIAQKMCGNVEESISAFKIAREAGSVNPVKEIPPIRIAGLENQKALLEAWGDELDSEGYPNRVTQEVEYKEVVAMILKIERLMHETIEYYEIWEKAQRSSAAGSIVEGIKDGWNLHGNHVAHAVDHFFEHIDHAFFHLHAPHVHGIGSAILGYGKEALKAAGKVVLITTRLAPKIILATLGVVTGPAGYARRAQIVEKKRPKVSVEESLIAQDKPGFFARMFKKKGGHHGEGHGHGSGH